MFSLCDIIPSTRFCILLYRVLGCSCVVPVYQVPGICQGSADLAGPTDLSVSRLFASTDGGVDQHGYLRFNSNTCRPGRLPSLASEVKSSDRLTRYSSSSSHHGLWVSRKTTPPPRTIIQAGHLKRERRAMRLLDMRTSYTADNETLG